MDGDAAIAVLETDVKFLQTSAHRLEDRLRSAAPVYLMFCITVAGAIIAAANVIAKGNNVSLESLIDANHRALAIIAALLCVLGILRILECARDRKHYLKVCSALNDLRQKVVKQMKLDGAYSRLWPNTDLKPWPPDSASTIALFTLAAAALVLEVITFALWHRTGLEIVLIAILTTIVLGLTVYGVSK